MRFVPVLLLLLLGAPAIAEPLIVEKHYNGFKVWIDCRNNGPIAYQMTLGEDVANKQFSSSFNIDTSIPVDTATAPANNLNLRFCLASIESSRARPYR